MNACFGLAVWEVKLASTSLQVQEAECKLNPYVHTKGKVTFAGKDFGMEPKTNKTHTCFDSINRQVFKGGVTPSLLCFSFALPP